MDAIGRLSGGVAHDFNNLLTVIVGQVGLLQTCPDLPPEAGESLTAISEAVERSANLTRQLLLFSRRQAMAPRVVDLNQVVEGMMKMLGRIVSEDITLRFERAPRPLPVHADVGMLEQVLLNLVVNARDAMPRGGEISIMTGPVSVGAAGPEQGRGARPGDWARLAVRDTGTGIAAQHLPRIFEPFFTTKPAGKGTGLGLATVYGIVQQHRGWIDVRTSVGAGSTFLVHLPEHHATEIEPLRRKPATADDRGHETILLVEDDRAVRRLVSIVLRAAGYRVIEAATGAEAIEQWERQVGGVHLLLTDLVMPRGISGRELAERFLIEAPQLRVVFMSGYNTDQDDRDQGLPSGAIFIAKPFDGDRLLAVVRSALDQAVG
jgi:CheY-like chemotaxis protein